MEDGKIKDMIYEINNFLDSITWSNRHIDSDLKALEGVSHFTEHQKEWVRDLHRTLRIGMWKTEIREEGTIPYAFYRTGRDREIS